MILANDLCQASVQWEQGMTADLHDSGLTIGHLHLIYSSGLAKMAKSSVELMFPREGVFWRPLKAPPANPRT